MTDIKNLKLDCKEFYEILEKYTLENKDLERQDFYTKCTQHILEYLKPFYPIIKCDLMGHNSKYESSLEDYVNKYSDRQYMLNRHPIHSWARSISVKIRRSVLEDTVYPIFPDKIIDQDSLEDIYTSMTCDACGEYYSVIFNLESLSFKVLIFDFDTEQNTKPCKHKIDNYQFDISIPTGKVIFANDLRDIFEEDQEDKYEGDMCFNSHGGKVQYSENCAKDGIGYIFAGNTSPSVFKDSDSSLSIGSSYLLEELEGSKNYKEWVEFAGKRTFSEEAFNYYKSLKPKNEVGSICTDLWAVMFMDVQRFEEITKNSKWDLDSYLKQPYTDAFVIDIEPGEYTVFINEIKANKDGFIDETNRFSIVKKNK